MSSCFALLKDGHEVKRHSTREACVIEAIERGWMLDGHADFLGDRRGRFLVQGVEIVTMMSGEASRKS